MGRCHKCPKEGIIMSMGCCGAIWYCQKCYDKDEDFIIEMIKQLEDRNGPTEENKDKNFHT